MSISVAGAHKGQLYYHFLTYFVSNVPSQPGREKYLADACLKKLADSQSSEARKVNVFEASRLVPCSIYIQAANTVQVCDLVEPFSDVFFNHTFDFITSEDVRSLQRLESVRLAAGNWARVTGKGRYRKDICNVIGVDDVGNIATVLLVPRVDLLKRRRQSKDSKGKGRSVVVERPEARLFRPDSSAKGFKRIDNGHVEFNGQVYADGLVTHTFPLKNLKIDTPTIAELEVFRQSTALDVSLIFRTWALCDAATVKEGDRVRVVEGQEASLVGKVLDIGNDAISFSSEQLGE